MWWLLSTGAIVNTAQIRALYIDSVSTDFAIFADLASAESDVQLAGMYDTLSDAEKALKALTQFFDPSTLV